MHTSFYISEERITDKRCARLFRESPIPGAILESRAVSPFYLLAAALTAFSFACLSQRKNFCSVITRRGTSVQPTNAYRLLRYKKVQGTGFWYSAHSASTTLVKCLESCRQEEKGAISERRAYPRQLLPFRFLTVAPFLVRSDMRKKRERKEKLANE